MHQRLTAATLAGGMDTTRNQRVSLKRYPLLRGIGLLSSFSIWDYETGD